jgi:hypothetical protein
MTITWDKTNRGFVIGEFTDRYNKTCSIQKSSLAFEDCIWLGQADLPPVRMHLTREMAAVLSDVLRKFADTGELEQSRIP